MVQKMVRTTQQTLKSISFRKTNVYAVTADEETTLCNRPDVKVSRSGRASVFYEVSVAGSDAQNNGPDIAYENLSLCQIRFY
jgi:hypothetical protein